MQVADSKMISPFISVRAGSLLPKGVSVWYKYRAMDDSGPEPPQPRGRLYQFASLLAISNLSLTGSAAENATGLPFPDFRQHRVTE
jgi:hypothetical protein